MRGSAASETRDRCAAILAIPEDRAASLFVDSIFRSARHTNTMFRCWLFEAAAAASPDGGGGPRPCFVERMLSLRGCVRLRAVRRDADGTWTFDELSLFGSAVPAMRARDMTSEQLQYIQKFLQFRTFSHMARGTQWTRAEFEHFSYNEAISARARRGDLLLRAVCSILRGCLRSSSSESGPDGVFVRWVRRVQQTVAASRPDAAAAATDDALRRVLEATAGRRADEILSACLRASPAPSESRARLGDARSVLVERE